MNFLNTATEPTVIQVPWDLRYWLIDHFALTGDRVAYVFLGVAFLCILIPYLIGSINPAILISKYFYNYDIRTHGSGNAGTTNMLRTYGKKLALLTFICDLLKAALAVIIGRLLLGTDGAALAGFFVAFGHMFPLYYKFRGGKGVACLAMVILLISPITFLILLGIFLVIVIGTRYVSLASVMCSLLYPLILRAFGNYGLNVAMAVFSAVFVTYMHRENLKRLRANEESKIDLDQFKMKRKKKKDDAEQTPSDEEKNDHE